MSTQPSKGQRYATLLMGYVITIFILPFVWNAVIPEVTGWTKINHFQGFLICLTFSAIRGVKDSDLIY